MRAMLRSSSCATCPNQFCPCHGSSLLWGALRQCVLLGHVLGPLGGPLPTVFPCLEECFPLPVGLFVLGLAPSAPVGGFSVTVHALWWGLTRPGGRWHLRGLLTELCLLFLWLVPVLAGHCITEGACCIIADLPGACRLHFQSLAMLEVRGHLLPQHSHFVQTLATAVRCIIVATDYVIHVLSLLPPYRQKGQKDRCLPPVFPLPSSGRRWRLVLLCRLDSKDTAVTELDACTTMSWDYPSALALWRKSDSLWWVASWWGHEKMHLCMDL